MKYWYEIVCVFKDYGYKIYPINPKYSEIEGIKCYPSLKNLPGKSEVVITDLAPKKLLSNNSNELEK